MKQFRNLWIPVAALALAACDDSTGPSLGFLGGTEDDRQIALVVNSTDNALTLFQVGAPAQQRQVAFGASETITPTGLSVSADERLAIVPLGNAASIALIDLTDQSIRRTFTFPSGNASGSAFVDSRTVLATNLIDDYVARFQVDQSATEVTQRTAVAPTPTEIVVHRGRAFVVSSNLDESYAALGNGVVTAVDPQTLQVLGTVETGGTNPQDAEVGPDGLLYVVNTGDYRSPGSVTVIDPQTLAVVRELEGFGVGPGSISIDRNGIAYVSGFFFGTLVYDTRTGQFVRGPDNPVCAPLPDGGCRGAFDAETDANGDLYQVFFGSSRRNLAPYVFRYDASTFALSDSISVGQGPTAIAVRQF